MKKIKNKKEFEKFYPYDKKYIYKYPKEYPCIVKWECEDRGLMGDERVVYVIYIPKKLKSKKDAFFEGLKHSWSVLK